MEPTPELWYAWNTILDVTDIVAFVDGRFPPGTVVTADEATAAGATFQINPPHDNGQVAAIRWFWRTGVSDMIYVQPTWRRRGIASVLFQTAKSFTKTQGWKSLRISGNRTALGELWAAQTGERVPPLRQRINPMTPPSDQIGVPRRLLEPDPPQEQE